MRVARDAGDISSLFPPGITSLADMPHTLFEAIRMALHFLGYSELPEEERPPKAIWLDADKMKLWWAEVNANRKAKYGGGGADLSSMPQNEWVKKLFGRAA